MNAEVAFDVAGGKTVRYSITPEGTIYEIRATGWRKVTSPRIRAVIFARLSSYQGIADA